MIKQCPSNSLTRDASIWAKIGLIINLLGTMIYLFGLSDFFGPCFPAIHTVIIKIFQFSTILSLFLASVVKFSLVMNKEASNEADLFFVAEKQALQILRCIGFALTCSLICGPAYLSIYPAEYYEIQQEYTSTPPSSFVFHAIRIFFCATIGIMEFTTHMKIKGVRMSNHNLLFSSIILTFACVGCAAYYASFDLILTRSEESTPLQFLIRMGIDINSAGLCVVFLIYYSGKIRKHSQRKLKENIENFKLIQYWIYISKAKSRSSVVPKI